jgi:hypothetical protein
MPPQGTITMATAMAHLEARALEMIRLGAVVAQNHLAVPVAFRTGLHEDTR